MSSQFILMIVNFIFVAFGSIPIALAGGVAVVSIDMRNGQVTSIGAAAAVGDGVSLAGVSTETRPVLLQNNQLSQNNQTENCDCHEQITNAFAINSDGDVDISGLMNISNDTSIVHSK